MRDEECVAYLEHLRIAASAWLRRLSSGRARLVPSEAWPIRQLAGRISLNRMYLCEMR